MDQTMAASRQEGKGRSCMTVVHDWHRHAPARRPYLTRGRTRTRSSVPAGAGQHRTSPPAGFRGRRRGAHLRQSRGTALPFSTGVEPPDLRARTTRPLRSAAAFIDSRLGKRTEQGTVIPSDQGVQFGSWAFTKRVKGSGLPASMGSIGDCYDKSMIEAFWSRMQVELLDRQKWNTRLELANAIFEYLEIWHNRKRRHSQLG
jgi:transposase InsO family protein